MTKTSGSDRLGKILHNATAEQPTQHQRWDERVVVTCKTCGAPQQQPAPSRACVFCGGDMFKTPEDP